MENAAVEKLVNQQVEKQFDVQKKQEQEKRLSEIRSLAVALAHQLRNRLGIIQTAIYNIKRKAADAPIGSSIDKIENSVCEASSIISNLLAFARIGMPKCEPTDIYALLEECLDNAKTTFAEWNVDLNVKDGDIRGRLIDADRTQLKSLFDNLLRNAYQALPEKRGAIDIGASIDEVNGEVAVRIGDNGVGMAPEDMAKIGEPFYSTKPDGVGLGLTACYQIVELHGGSIRFESDPSRGTTVTVTLPYKS